MYEKSQRGVWKQKSLMQLTPQQRNAFEELHKHNSSKRSFALDRSSYLSHIKENAQMNRISNPNVSEAVNNFIEKSKEQD
jgi:hypothetical protein